MNWKKQLPKVKRLTDADRVQLQIMMRSYVVGCLKNPNDQDLLIGGFFAIEHWIDEKIDQAVLGNNSKILSLNSKLKIT